MLPSRAGLETRFPLKLATNISPLLMKTVAVMILIISLSTAVAHAAALPTRPADPQAQIPGSDVPFIANGDYAMKWRISSREVYHIVKSGYKSGTPHTGISDHHAIIHCTMPPAICSQELGGKVQADTVILIRRTSIAAKIRAAFHKFGQKVKHAFQKAGHAIKHAFQKVGHAIKTAAQKVGHFIKTTGAKIAKVALKIVATVGKVASKVIGFLPGVGKVVWKAIEGASEGLNKASDAIHAHIGGKLGNAMERMDKAQHIVGKIP